MNKNRKTLKEYSVIILIFAALSLIRMIVDVCVHGFDFTGLNVEGVTEEFVKVAVIISFVLALVLLIPDVYVGVKGIKEANAPTGARAHIVWALVLAILSAIATVSAIIDVASDFNASKLIECLDVAVDTALFFAYYVTARKVKNEK